MSAHAARARQHEASTRQYLYGPQNLKILQEPASPALAQQVLLPEPLLFRYQFREPLIEGVILRKRKRFTADVAINGQVVMCHCPTTCLSLYQTLLDGQQVCARCGP